MSLRAQCGNRELCKRAVHATRLPRCARNDKCFSNDKCFNNMRLIEINTTKHTTHDGIPVVRF
jgi:hypothetical protein